MHITTILGSPRSKGNTASVLSMAEMRLEASKHDVTRFDVAKMKINGCLGCLKCQRPADGPACVQKDDLSQIFDSMMKADVIIYATPNYGWGPTAQLKAALDRHLSLLTGYGTPQMGCHVSGKKAALLVTAMGPIEDNSDLLDRPFEKMIGMMQCESLGSFHLPGTIDPEMAAKAGPDLADALVRAIVS